MKRDEIGFNQLSPRAKLASIAVAAAVVGLVALDFLVLEGDHVARMNVRLDASAPGVFEVTRPWEEHLIDIYTPHRSGSESEGRSVQYRVTGPDGEVIAENDELVSRRHRYVRFTPMSAGDHRVVVKDGGLLFGAPTSTASVRVTAGDRRILTRFHLF